MAVPKRRKSKSQARKRRGGQRKPQLMKLQYCTQCGTAVPSHVVCPNCGHYQGRPMVTTEE